MAAKNRLELVQRELLENHRREVRSLKILWFSRHEPLPSQADELRRLFGPETVIEQEPKPFASAEEVVARYRDGGYDDIVIVAPLSVIARLVDLGVKPLWAEMAQVSQTEAEVSAKRRDGRIDHYRFDRFRRVNALRLEFKEL